MLAVEDGDVAEDAGDFALGVRGELGGEGLFFVLELEEADFDEFVVGEGAVGRGYDGGRKAVFADHDDGIEVVCERSELFFVGCW